MTRSLEILGGRIRAFDENGDTVFDTDERMLVWTDFKTGQVNVPQRQATSSNGARQEVNVDQDTAVASIHPDATVVFGAFKSSLAASAEGLASGGWFQATGSFMHQRLAINATGNTSGGMATPPWVSIGGHQILTFRAANGLLIFNERTFLRSTLGLGATVLTANCPASTIDYKLFCGAFV